MCSVYSKSQTAFLIFSCPFIQSCSLKWNSECVYGLCFKTYSPPDSTFKEAIFPDNLYRKDEGQRRKLTLLIVILLSLHSVDNKKKRLKTEQVYAGQGESSKTWAGERQGHRALLKRTVWYPKPQYLSSKDPSILGFCVLACPVDLWEIGFKLQVSREPCMFPELFHWALGGKGQVLPSLDTAVVGIARGFYGFYLIKSGFSRLS